MFGEDAHKRLGFNILRERRLKGMTQEELAEAVGMSRPRLSAIERGTTTLTLEKLMMIARALGVDYRKLME